MFVRFHFGFCFLFFCHTMSCYAELYLHTVVNYGGTTLLDVNSHMYPVVDLVHAQDVRLVMVTSSPISDEYIFD